MLTKEEFDEFIQARAIAESKEGVIHKRVTEVLDIYGEFFGSKLDTWWFEGAEEGEVGRFRWCGDDISLRIEWRWRDATRPQDENKFKKKLFQTYYKHTVYFPDLFEQDADITARLQEEVDELADKAAKSKEKREKRKAHKEKLVEEAMNKLTPEEAKALGIKM